MYKRQRQGRAEFLAHRVAQLLFSTIEIHRYFVVVTHILELLFCIIGRFIRHNDKRRLSGLDRVLRGEFAAGGLSCLLGQAYQG